MFTLQSFGLASTSFNQPSSVDSGGASIGSPRVFTYHSNTDTVAQISAADYFLSLNKQITDGDLIYAKGTDTNIFLTVTSVSSTSVLTDIAVNSDGTLSGKFVLNGTVTTAEILENKNNYSPTGFDNCSILRLVAETLSFNITGFAGGVDGRLLLLFNAGSFTLFLGDQDPLSLPENRMNFSDAITPGYGYYNLLPFQSILLRYDGALGLWLIASDSPTAGTNITYFTEFDTGRISFNALSKAITPAIITSNQNNYFPDGLVDHNIYRLSTDASRNITGIAPNNSDMGFIIIIYNVGSFNIVLKNQDALSSSINRFLFGSDLTLTPNTCAVIQYDATDSRWRLLSTTA